MQLADYFNRTIVETKLRKRYEDWVRSHPKTRQRDNAQVLGISEAELIDKQLGVKSVRLRPDFKALLNDLPDLGYIMNLTRNDSAVHECKGCYQNIHINGNMGLVLGDDRKIDLRLFLSHWKFVYAVREGLQQGERYSLQFFDISGKAIQKIFLQANSQLDHYHYLVENYISEDQTTEIVFLENTEKENEAIIESTINQQGLKNDWRSMTDVHQFVHLLRKHQVNRQQAFRIVGSDYAEEFVPTELERILRTAAQTQLPIMCFVGNRASIQIFSGAIHRVKTVGKWLNILDAEFNLHLLEDDIAESWLVRKPTADGIITSLEFYDENQQQVVQFFGQRQEGRRENPLWTKLAESVFLESAPYQSTAVRQA